MAQVSEHSDATMRLESSLPDWCVLTWRHMLVCLSFVVMFLYFSYLPIPVSSTWHDLWTGGTIASEGLYATDPSLPLAEGVRHHTNGWLGRVIVFQVFQHGGYDLLSFSFAALQTLTVTLWALLLLRMSNRWWVGLLAVTSALVCGWTFEGFTTLTLGQLCFAIVACLLFGDVGRDAKIGTLPSYLHWAALLSTMLLWTNVDGSFLLGWGLVFLSLVSRAVDVLSRPNENGRVKALLADAELRQWLVLLELCILVALVNPLGWQLHQTLLWWPDQPTWQSLGGWQPLSLASWSGLALATLWGFWLFASRYADRMATWQWLLPVAGSVLVATCQTTLIWVAPLMLLSACAMFPSTQSQHDNLPPKRSAANDSKEPVPLQFAFTLICGLVLWLGFTFSPFSHAILGGQGRTASQLLGAAHPSASIGFLRSHQSTGQGKGQKDGLLWCPAYWSDATQAPNDITPVFANRDMQSLPAQAQSDYFVIYNAQDRWRKLLDQYNVSRLMIDKKRQRHLLKLVRRQPGKWKIVHEDAQAVVLFRRVAS